MQRINADHVVVPIIWADSHDGAVAGDIISMKNYRQCDFYLMIGELVGQAAAVTLHKGTSVSSAATACTFTKYFSTGHLLKYDGASSDTPAAAAETATGAAGGISYVYQDLGGLLVCYAFNGTAFVDNETLTFSGGKTAVVNGVLYNEDIWVPRTAASNTFNISAVTSKMYCIPVSADMLGDGYDCIELNVADANASYWAAWAVLSEPRYMAEIPETAIYN